MQGMLEVPECQATKTLRIELLTDHVSSLIQSQMNALLYKTESSLGLRLIE